MKRLRDALKEQRARASFLLSVCALLPYWRRLTGQERRCVCNRVDFGVLEASQASTRGCES